MADSILNIIKKRRSIRHFIQKEVADSILLELVEAAIWAPTGGNIQMWYFVIVKENDILERVKAFSPGLLGDPACLVVICSDRKKAFEKAGTLGKDELCVMDIPMAAQNLMLLAAEKGLGTCPVGSFNKKAISRILELPEYISPDLIISVGYPADDAKPPKRKGIGEVTFMNKWSVNI
jgi:nitroreductase